MVEPGRLSHTTKADEKLPKEKRGKIGKSTDRIHLEKTAVFHSKSEITSRIFATDMVTITPLA
jgi:hypothetical protein